MFTIHYKGTLGEFDYSPVDYKIYKDGNGEDFLHYRGIKNCDHENIFSDPDKDISLINRNSVKPHTTKVACFQQMSYGISPL